MKYCVLKWQNCCGNKCSRQERQWHVSMMQASWSSYNFSWTSSSFWYPIRSICHFRTVFKGKIVLFFLFALIQYLLNTSRGNRCNYQKKVLLCEWPVWYWYRLRKISQWDQYLNDRGVSFTFSNLNILIS